MRRFYLENAIGERRDLQTVREIHLRTPAGLGWADNNTYASAKGFFPRTHSEPAQPAVSGEFVINGYDVYSELVDWVFKGYDLTLVYDPAGAEYRIDVDILSLQKGEENLISRLECPFTMAAKTPWYKPIARELVIAPAGSESGYRRYTYAYTTQYAASSISSSVPISVNGHMPAAIYMTCPGLLVNPKLTLTNANGETVGVMDLSGVTFEADELLIYSTKFGNIGVWKDGVDLLADLDLNNNNFFEIPTNQSCTLTLESDSDIETTATIQIFEYYRSV
jgi:hypothetical protein